MKLIFKKSNEKRREKRKPYMKEYNKKYVLIKIKYHGKLNKIIKQLEKQKIILEQKRDQWSLKII